MNFLFADTMLLTFFERIKCLKPRINLEFAPLTWAKPICSQFSDKKHSNNSFKYKIIVWLICEKIDKYKIYENAGLP